MRNLEAVCVVTQYENCTCADTEFLISDVICLSV